jgi:TolB-like protein
MLLAAAMLMTAEACQDVQQNIGNAPVVTAMSDTVHALPGLHGTTGLEVHAVRSIRTVIIHKIAVMPLVDQPDQIERSLPQGAAQSITAALYARASEVGGWEVVAQDDVDAALQQLPPLTLADFDQDALALGRKTTADGVIYGTVQRYRERVGFDYAAQTPAAVAFTLNFVDENTRQVVWTAKFAREQKALAQNILELPNFVSHGARWVRAHDIAVEGINGALDNLQSKLTIEPVVQGK